MKFRGQCVYAITDRMTDWETLGGLWEKDMWFVGTREWCWRLAICRLVLYRLFYVARSKGQWTRP